VPPSVDPELQRRNVRLGLLLFGIALAILAATVGIAFLYLAFD
jgi:hypothetical protein